MYDSLSPCVILSSYGLPPSEPIIIYLNIAILSRYIFFRIRIVQSDLYEGVFMSGRLIVVLLYSFPMIR